MVVNIERSVRMVKLYELLSVERIRILDTADKTEALKAVCQLMSTAESVTDPVELEKALFERESIISTSIGLGIAIPHVRLESVTKMTMAVGIVKEGIEYNAFDDLPVNIIIMIAAPAGSHREYLSLLATIALLLKNNTIRKKLVEANKPEQIYEVLKGH